MSSITVTATTAPIVVAFLLVRLLTLHEFDIGKLVAVSCLKSEHVLRGKDDIQRMYVLVHGAQG
eukprot:m.256246 g.256246  ORF g.256246 m.256246 type:complete len:64 (+) comp15513_c5_seq3:1863-2054(+)